MTCVHNKLAQYPANINNDWEMWLSAQQHCASLDLCFSHWTLFSQHRQISQVSENIHNTKNNGSRGRQPDRNNQQVRQVVMSGDEQVTQQTGNSNTNSKLSWRQSLWVSCSESDNKHRHTPWPAVLYSTSITFVCVHNTEPRKKNDSNWRGLQPHNTHYCHFNATKSKQKADCNAGVSQH